MFRAVIRFDSVSKNHGQQILFMEASAAVNRGEPATPVTAPPARRFAADEVPAGAPHVLTRST